MGQFLKILPTKADQPRLSIWIFILAWLMGNFALIAGLNADGLWENGVTIGIFAIVCAVWWGAFRLGRAKPWVRDTAGLMVIALWALHLLGAILFYFDHYIPDTFFWASAAMLLLLVVSVALSERPSG